MPKRFHQRTTREGRTMGEKLIRLTTPAVHRLRLAGEEDERCKTCAFRHGTVPNGCPQTQADALKAVSERVPFYCHETHERGQICHGWYAVCVMLRQTGVPEMQCPWDFSAPDAPTKNESEVSDAGN